MLQQTSSHTTQPHHVLTGLAKRVVGYCSAGAMLAMSLSAHAVDNTKIMPYGLYQTPDKTIWMRCSLGQTWNGKTCTGKAKEYDWRTAQTLAKKHVHKGIKGWRLPTISELHGLVSCSSGFNEQARIPVSASKKKTLPNLCNEGASKPTINTTVFPHTPEGLFWSRTTDPLQNGFAWYTFFGGGYSHIYNMDTKNYVRLVKIPLKKKAK